jgi:hypothetical protein
LYFFTAFVGDTGLLITNSNYGDFLQNISAVFHVLNGWFKANQLTTNFNRTHYIQFTANNSNNSLTDIKVAYDKEESTALRHNIFLGIYIDDKMSWEHHIEHEEWCLLGCYAVWLL